VQGEFEDGTWHREESIEMENTIRDGELLERVSGVSMSIAGS
jgi:hypothetical protein